MELSITFLDTYQTDFASKDIEAKASLMIVNLDFVTVVYAVPDVLDAFAVVPGLDASYLEAVRPLRPLAVAHTYSYYDDFDEPNNINEKYINCKILITIIYEKKKNKEHNTF